MIVLDEGLRNAKRCKRVLVVALQKESAFVAEDARLEQQKTGKAGGEFFHRVPCIFIKTISKSLSSGLFNLRERRRLPAAAEAVSAERGIAAVNRCATQNQRGRDFFQRACSLIKKRDPSATAAGRHRIHCCASVVPALPVGRR